MTKSIRTLFTVPLVILIVTLALVIIGVSYYNGHRAVGEIGLQLHQEISARIRQQVRTFLQAPHFVNALNTKLDVSNFENLAKQFQHQVNTSDVPYVFYGDEQGNFIGVQRMEDKTVLKIRDQKSASLRHIYEIDESGRRILQLRNKTQKYDPRRRPWYQKAKKVRKATWSEIYVSAHRNVLQVTPVAPVFDKEGKLRGVFGANFILSQISDFLKELKIGKTGQAFIMDSTGKLIAASTDTPLSKQFGISPRPLSAERSENPVIQSVAQHITHKWGSISSFANQQRNEVFKLDGRTTELSLYEDRRGIHWIIAVTIPDTDFTEGIQDNLLWTLGLSLLAILVAIIVGIFVAQQVTNPILQLNQHVKELTTGDWKTWNLSTDINRKDEIGELALSFSTMAEQLAGLLGAFEETVDKSVAGLRQANADLEAFSRSVAHDLRNPVGEVLGLADAVLETYGDKLDMQARQFLQLILSSSEKSIEIIDSLLLLAVTSKEEVEVQSLDMRSILLSATERVESTRKKYYGSIMVPETLPNASGHRAWIEEVWVNYLTNGLKYGGVPPNLEIGAKVKGSLVEYWIQDNGEGMTASEASKLFTEATRLDKHRSHRDGFGFGLSIVHRIVTKLGGGVGVESQAGKGSRFWFTLPRHKKAIPKKY
jgi:two-component system, sensor histidine kinase ChiS